MIIASFLVTKDDIRGYDITRVFESELAMHKWANTQVEFRTVILNSTRPATLFDVVMDTAKLIPVHRTENDILNHAMQELGELAQEIAIFRGKSLKDKGADGIIGEAIDVINCMLDIIYVHNKNVEGRFVSPLSENQLTEIARMKCLKWENNVGYDRRKCHEN